MKSYLIYYLAFFTKVQVHSANRNNSCMKRNKHQVQCSLFPATLMGQHFLPKSPKRQDVRDGEPGTVLLLTLIVVDHENCLPVPNVKVQIWHADPIGNYSQFAVNPVPNPSLEPRGISLFPTQNFLRGHQYTNRRGRVKFITVFPGWIGGRTTHIHINTIFNGQYHFGQIYFSEYLTQRITSKEPYIWNPWPRTPNSRDCEYLCYDGSATVTNWDKELGYYKSTVILGYDLDVKAREARQLESGVKCTKPDKDGSPHCKRIIATRNITIVYAEI